MSSPDSYSAGKDGSSAGVVVMIGWFVCVLFMFLTISARRPLWDRFAFLGSDFESKSLIDQSWHQRESYLGLQKVVF
jgi:uncharacterized protein (DUF983 family)